MREPPTPREPIAVERFAFLGDLVDAEDSELTVRFRYVIDGSAELSLSRQWWEQLGSPESVEVSVSPEAA
jgi:hypothetical protein